MLKDPKELKQELLGLKAAESSVVEDTKNAMVGAAISHITGQPSQQQLFEILDKNQNGIISFAEFKPVSKYLGVTVSDDNLMRVFSAADKKNKKYIRQD